MTYHPKDTLGIEKHMNCHWLTSDLGEGGLGLRQLWWSYVTRWITLGQSEVPSKGPF